MLTKEEFEKGLLMILEGKDFTQIANELNKKYSATKDYYIRRGFKNGLRKLKYTNCLSCNKKIVKNIRKGNKFSRRNKFCNDECKSLYVKGGSYRKCSNKKYNWSDIQVFYDSGASWREIQEKFGVCKQSIRKAKKRGDLVTSRSISDGMKKCIERGRRKNFKHTDEFKKALSIEQSIKNRGGKCKWFEVSGKRVQGTWEKKMAEYFDIHTIEWIKPKKNSDIWEYKHGGKIKRYTPDFFLPEYNLFLEIKGYWWGNDKEKMKLVLEQHQDKRIVIIEKKEYNELLNGILTINDICLRSSTGRAADL